MLTGEKIDVETKDGAVWAAIVLAIWAVTPILLGVFLGGRPRIYSFGVLLILSVYVAASPTATRYVLCPTWVRFLTLALSASIGFIGFVMMKLENVTSAGFTISLVPFYHYFSLWVSYSLFLTLGKRTPRFALFSNRLDLLPDQLYFLLVSFALAVVPVLVFVEYVSAS